MNRLIVVSGLPASGKSTVAKALASSLELPLFDKDTFLEALFEITPVKDAQMRKDLSLRADGEFQDHATRSGSAVLASWWRHPRSSVNSGTPTEWLVDLPGTHVEIHCICSPSVAAERFLCRKRHPGHLDSRWLKAELLASFKQQASFGSVGFGHLIEVNTERALELIALVRTVAQIFTKHGDRAM